MRKTRPMRIAASRPRNPVVRALLALGKRGSSSAHRAREDKRASQLARMDLDQRVREVGEW